MADVIGHHLGDDVVGAGVTDAPAGHGVCLGYAVDQDGALLGVGAEGGEAGEGAAVVGQAGVDLVGNHINIRLSTHSGDGLQLLSVVHHAGWVGGIVEQNGLGPGGDGGRELFRCQLEVLCLGGGHHHRHAAHHLDELNVAHPVGRRQNDLVTGVDHCPQSQVDQVLGAAAHHHLAGLVLQSVVGLHAAAHRLTQLHRAGCGGIAGDVLLNGRNAGCLDVVGGVEVGLPRSEADHIHTVGLHLLEHGVDSHGGGGLYGRCNPGQLFHWNRSLVLKNRILLYDGPRNFASPRLIKCKIGVCRLADADKLRSGSER